MLKPLKVIVPVPALWTELAASAHRASIPLDEAARMNTSENVTGKSQSLHVETYSDSQTAKFVLSKLELSPSKKSVLVLSEIDCPVAAPDMTWALWLQAPFSHVTEAEICAF
ncbi:hypothetical protein CALCODRAFT_82141 [Calocera cornea HHB12733]|uniref:Uncharacterized protein n=1 Tax=Calocera cornea HHB12733 TaxID=1353952 RepID=A0A165DE23_9BASI|nr:hypothetical protein CALCODRAFT_82141 [Calocera cornea HHB12733]